MNFLEYEFMRNALAAGILVSVACGVIGTLVVLNRMVFISAGIAHAAYGGIGLGYFLRWDPTLTAMGFSVAAALSMGWVERTTRERTDTLIGVMWAIGMAMGVLFLDRTEGYKADLMTYLFGNILTVPGRELWGMAAADVVIVGVVWLFQKEFVALSFDEQFARIRDVPVTVLYLVMVGLIGLTVVVMMRLVGLILVIALLTMPAAMAGLIASDMRRMMIVASCLGMLFTTAGLGLSYLLNVSSGAAVILVGGGAYLMSLAVHGRFGRRRGPRFEAARPGGAR